DLQEIPRKVVDANNNGVFDGNDYILFYATGPHRWNYDSQRGMFIHRLNIYRDRNFYFITMDNGPGGILQNAAPMAQAPTQTVTTFDDYDFREDEKENLVGAGSVWLGDVFDFNLQQSSSFNFPDIVPSSQARLRIKSHARASTANT